ncbi:uracil-DNA glycosylase [Alkalihalophilus marmarensis]|jgi:uracil-DNA glycosylase|uniref:Uracil-DNA glycosylase n=1 Tax=Alkalihalophilus marmarensis DSM 21297 TaxID=1188261 RepID=U6SJW5_9BACI|nr:uracil-DNA glycosylase [Alkalihalophilus marmarensis]ERN51682.1 uracil-DNA glycosylase [Alkalihalophilus marmarensis DSM 21297]MCM3491637.1 uracil-DNA glycosylase [Alkalihalophilus marmarensis]
MSILKNDWNELLKDQFEQPYYKELREFLKKEYQEEIVYPSMHHLFEALQLTSYRDTKVVILGQDPYHGLDQAHGLSFSVRPEVRIPPSLQNMFKELKEDLGASIPNNGYLVPWAEQGVLLLNTVLSVRGGQAASHKGRGWELFTDRVIDLLNEREKPVIFVLWGKHAEAKSKRITNDHHFIITAPHPSPLSAHRGFFGSRPFSKINRILTEMGEEPIEWQLPNR